MVQNFKKKFTSWKIILESMTGSVVMSEVDSALNKTENPCFIATTEFITLYMVSTNPGRNNRVQLCVNFDRF